MQHTLLSCEVCVSLQVIAYYNTSQAPFLPADRTSASPLSTAAIIGIAVSGTVILVVVLLLAVTLLLGWKYLHSKQTAGALIQ